jgi:hypothetical protein
MLNLGFLNLKLQQLLVIILSQFISLCKYCLHVFIVLSYLLFILADLFVLISSFFLNSLILFADIIDLSFLSLDLIFDGNPFFTQGFLFLEELVQLWL